MTQCLEYHHTSRKMKKMRSNDHYHYFVISFYSKEILSNSFGETQGVANPFLGAGLGVSTTHRGAHGGIFLCLCSRMTPGSAQETICGDQIRFSCMQSKRLISGTIQSTQIKQLWGNFICLEGHSYLYPEFTPGLNLGTSLCFSRPLAVMGIKIRQFVCKTSALPNVVSFWQFLTTFKKSFIVAQLT